MKAEMTSLSVRSSHPLVGRDSVEPKLPPSTLNTNLSQLTAETFMRQLDAATDRAALDVLLPKIQRIRCPFRQRQALFDAWNRKSSTVAAVCDRRPSSPVGRDSVEPILQPSTLNTNPTQLLVTPVEFETGRYWVQSRTNGGIPYLVDMDEFGGNGWCGCKGFLHYIESLENGEQPSPALQCRHIKAVREWINSVNH